MAVSYLSTPFRSSPYVPPVDLNLLSSVLSYKEGQFTQEYEKIKGQIDQMSSLDVIKDEDRQYLNNKINNLTSNINSMGGVDLGDMNVGNQIESYGSDIYNDSKVINAVSSTKRIRNLQSSYERLKSDPKMTKYYSAANEHYDMKNINAYLNDPNVGASYTGNSTATPYQDYSKYYNDVLQKIIPQRYTKVNNSNGYLDTETGNILTEQDIYNIAEGYLTPNMRDQMKRDGTYLYETNGFGKDQVIGKALQDDDNTILQTNNLIDQLKAAKAAETSPSEKDKLQKAIDAQASNLVNLNNNRKRNSDYYNNLYDQNPDEMMYLTYKNDYFKAVGKKYAVNQIEHKVIADPYQLEKVRQDRQDARALLQNQTIIEAARIRAEAEGKGHFDENGNWVTNSATSSVNNFGTDNLIGAPNTQTRQDRVSLAIVNLDGVNNQLVDYTNQLVQIKKQEDPSLNDQQAQLAVNQMLKSLELSADGNSSLVKNLPSNTSDIYEQIQLLKLKRDNLQSGLDNYIKTGEDRFTIPNYSLIPINEDNKVVKDLTTTWKAGLIASKGLPNKPEDITILGFSHHPDGSEGYNIVYARKDGKNTVQETVPISNETAQTFGITAAPADMETLDNYVDSYTPFTSIVQNQIDPSFSARIQVYKIGEKQYGIKYFYSGGGGDLPVNKYRLPTEQEVQNFNQAGNEFSSSGGGGHWIDLTNNQPFSTASEAYTNIKNVIKNFTSVSGNSRAEFNKYADKLATNAPTKVPVPKIATKPITFSDLMSSGSYILP